MEEQTHPLEHPKILKTFFRVCPQTLESTLVYRQVCKAWNLATNKQWLKLAPLKLALKGADRTNGIFCMQDYFSDFQIVYNSLRGLYRNFTLIEWKIIPDHFLDTDLSNNILFWRSAGRHMTTLTLSHCEIYYNLCLLTGPFWKHVPHLTSLTLLNCQFVLRREEGTLFKREQIYWVTYYMDEIKYCKQQERILLVKIHRQSEKDHRVKCLTGELKKFQKDITEMEDTLQDIKQHYRGSPGSTNEIYLHNLKSLCVKSTNNSGMPLDIDYGKVMDYFPQLEKIVIRLQRIRHRATSKVADGRVLKELDVMETNKFLNKMLPLSILTMPVESLTFDCGLEATAEKVGSVLESQAANLRKLSLFRAPYAEPLSSIPCNIKLELLTELQLWGTVTSNLNFLKLMPNLQQFKWNTNCYDEETHGARLHQKLGQDGIHIMYADEIVRNTDELGDDFRLKNLSTFELECGALKFDTIMRLEKWFPNLRALKVVVPGGFQLIQIGQHWPALEHLELAHGSYVAPYTIVDICMRNMIFQSLKSFTWKSCSCYTEEIGARHAAADRLLRRLVAEKVTLPWKECQDGQVESTCSATECVRDLYEKALIFGEEAAFQFRKFLNPPPEEADALDESNSSLDSFGELSLES